MEVFLWNRPPPADWTGSDGSTCGGTSSGPALADDDGEVGRGDLRRLLPTGSHS